MISTVDEKRLIPRDRFRTIQAVEVLHNPRQRRFQGCGDLLSQASESDDGALNDGFKLLIGENPLN